MLDADVITTLNNIQLRLNQVLPLILLVGGTFGHLCNIAILSKRSQRTNPIAVYFLGSTIASMLVLYVGLVPRYLSDAYGIDLINNDATVCKTRSFLLYVSLSLSSWYILLATVDRYLISSDNNHRRQLSTIKNAHRAIGCVTVLCVLFYIHIPILYTIQTFLVGSNRLQNFCYPQRGPYRIFSDVQVLVLFSLLPPLLMSLFIILIINNIHHSHGRLAATVGAHQQARMRKRDLQLSKMLLLQVIITIICSMPLAISQLLTTMTLAWTKTALRLAIESFFTQIGRYLTFVNCSMSFYLYTLAGSQFRMEFRQSLNRLFVRLCRRPVLGTRRVGIDEELPVAETIESTAPRQPPTNAGATDGH